MLKRQEITEVDLYHLLYFINKTRNVLLYEKMEVFERRKLLEEVLLLRSKLVNNTALTKHLDVTLPGPTIRSVLETCQDESEAKRDFRFINANPFSGVQCENPIESSEGSLLLDKLFVAGVNKASQGSCRTCSIDRFSNGEDGILRIMNKGNYSSPNCVTHDHSRTKESSFRITIKAGMLGRELLIREFKIQCSDDFLRRVINMLSHAQSINNPAHLVDLLRKTHDSIQPTDSFFELHLIIDKKKDTSNLGLRRTMKAQGYEQIIDLEVIIDAELEGNSSSIGQRFIQIIGAGWNPLHFSSINTLFVGGKPTPLEEMLLPPAIGSMPLWPSSLVKVSSELLDHINQHGRSEAFDTLIMKEILFEPMDDFKAGDFRMEIDLDTVVLWRI